MVAEMTGNDTVIICYSVRHSHCQGMGIQVHSIDCTHWSTGSGRIISFSYTVLL